MLLFVVRLFSCDFGSSVCFGGVAAGYVSVAAICWVLMVVWFLIVWWFCWYLCGAWLSWFALVVACGFCYFDFWFAIGLLVRAGWLFVGVCLFVTCCNWLFALRRFAFSCVF